MSRVPFVKLKTGSPNTVREPETDDWLHPKYQRRDSWDRRLCQISKVPGSGVTTVRVDGSAATVTTGGTLTGIDSTTHALVEFKNTTSTSGDTSGFISSFNLVAAGWGFEWSAQILTAASIANIRIFAGLTSVDMSGSSPADASALAVNLSGIQYGTDRDGTAFFRSLTADGTTCKVVVGTGAIAASKSWLLRGVEDILAGKNRFFVRDLSSESNEDVLISEHSANLPTAGVLLGAQVCVTTLAASQKRVGFSRFTCSSR